MPVSTPYLCWVVSFEISVQDEAKIILWFKGTFEFHARVLVDCVVSVFSFYYAGGMRDCFALVSNDPKMIVVFGDIDSYCQLARSGFPRLT